MHGACRLVSLAELAADSAIPCSRSCGNGFSWIFNYPTLISKLVFYAKTNNNNRQWWILGDLNMLMKRQIVLYPSRQRLPPPRRRLRANKNTCSRIKWHSHTKVFIIIPDSMSTRILFIHLSPAPSLLCRENISRGTSTSTTCFLLRSNYRMKVFLTDCILAQQANIRWRDTAV